MESNLLSFLAFPFYFTYFVIHRRVRRTSCAWCAKAPAFYKREGSRCCRSCAKKTDSRIRELTKPYRRSFNGR